MSYSTHAQLVRLLDDIDAYTWQFTDLRFYGMGINDMQPSGVGKASTTVAINFVVKIIQPGTHLVLTLSDNDGASFRSSGVYIKDLDSGVFGLDYGVQVTFIDYDYTVVIDSKHVLNDYWKFTANPPDSSTFRDLANDWINVNLEQTHPVPFTDPVDVIKLTEATYAIYLILRANNDPRSAAFHQEAVRLITLLTTFKIVPKAPEAIIKEAAISVPR